MKRLKMKQGNWGYFFIAPFFIVFLIFGLYPIVFTFQLSMKSWNGFSEIKKAGFSNWARIFKDEFFWLTIKNTLKIWIMDFIPQLFFALVLSLIFSLNKIRGMRFFRAVYYLPNLITAASIGLLFNLLFGGEGSTINNLLVTLGVDGAPFHFFQSPAFTQGIASYILWWMWFGYTTVLVMAGITAIDPFLYEAAQLDSCNQRQIFTKITMPLIRPTIIYITVTSVIGGMQIFDVPANLTNMSGDPQKAILTTSMYVYTQGFTNRNFGYASALSVALFLIIAALSFLVFKFMQRKGEN